MISLIVKCDIPTEVLWRDLHGCGNIIAVGTQECAPHRGVVVSQPFCVLPVEGDDVRLTADLFEPNEYGDMDECSELLEGHELRGYQDQITAVLVKNRLPEESERGLMHWYVDDANGHLSSKGLYTTDSNGKIRISGITRTIVVKGTKTIDGCTVDESTRTQTVLVNPADTQTLTFYDVLIGGVDTLKRLIADFRMARQNGLLWSEDIVELNKQISDIASQERLLAQLKQQAVVDPDIFISRGNLLAERRREIKRKKEQLLRTEEDDTIQQTEELLDILENGPDWLDSFDAELFENIVEKIIVVDHATLRFRLLNGLEVTEPIERRKR